MHKKLIVGDWVQICSKDEILRTLDSQGQLDGMPLMPEMLQYCGRRFQVFKRAHKTCDYSSPYPYHTRRLNETVHLETRCDGEAHDGCQAGCLLYWKQAWLKPVDDERTSDAVLEVAACGLAIPAPGNAVASPETGCGESELRARTQIPDPNGGPPTYVCQATQIPYATEPLAWWDVRQYIEDNRSGNVGLGRVLSGLAYSIYYHVIQSGIGLGRPMTWLYDKFQALRGGTPYPRKPGLIPAGKSTPSAALNLQPGELVSVKSQEEILKTVDSTNRNRGMYWDAELVPYCGGEYRVLKRVTKLIDEKNGRMVEMKNPCIILDSVVCQARYSPCRMLCPKSMYPYWREIWLDRVATIDSDNSVAECGKSRSISEQ